ncbi:LytTR family transcriptional regulator DNA-binding domain-containing protein [Candidatus Enterococcus courvalinii]|uniref:Response regulator transcription factor n=1 Tax=Candidatus Enterococcus courvalinii TaxID=2815329 RepID=A0ABS3HX34_9ENTE|nr:response regulator transcription factor [Enterococcus sp. MSG2901]
MNIYVIEDNPFFRTKMMKVIQQVIAESGYVYHMKEQVVTAKEMLAEDLSEGPHIYLLDIELQEQYNGIDLGREIRKIDTQGYILYITSLENKLITIIDEHIAPLAFLSKKIDEQVIKENIQSAFEKIKQREEQRSDNHFFTLQRAGNQARIAYKELLYFEKVPRSKKVMLYTTNGVYAINHYLSSIKEKLVESQFIFLNSFIIHKSSIQKLDAKEDAVTFKDGSELFVGKHTFRKIKAQFQS